MVYTNLSNPAAQWIPESADSRKHFINPLNLVCFRLKNDRIDWVREIILNRPPPDLEIPVRLCRQQKTRTICARNWMEPQSHHRGQVQPIIASIRRSWLEAVTRRNTQNSNHRSEKSAISADQNFSQKRLSIWYQKLGLSSRPSGL